MLVDAHHSSLLIIDIQERLLPAMHEGAQVISHTQILMKAAEALCLPITISEQYPKGLGKTVPEIANTAATVFEKTSFSCWRDPAMKKHFINHHEQDRPLVIIAGIETHVCVLQTAVDLHQAGFGVFVVADATSSRGPASVDLALARLRQTEIQLINTEMAVFELLGKAGTPEFKALSALIR
jgi:nicotinamidase-related amidase